MKVRLVSSLLLVSIGLVPGKLAQPVVAMEISSEAQVEQSTSLNSPETFSTLNSKAEAEILERSVQIKMYTPVPGAALDYKQSESEPEEYLVTNGLGSLVVWQEKYVIVTHNHWAEGLDQAEYVQILDWHGKLLRTLDKAKLEKLILYEDPGTLVLYDPTATWISAGHLGNETDMQIGDIVTIAHQDPDQPGQVDLMQATVVGYRENNNLSILEVVVKDNEKIIGGDSGGGVWMDGKLVGNTWAVVSAGDEVNASNSGLIAQLPDITFEEQDEPEESPIAPLYTSSDPIMW